MATLWLLQPVCRQIKANPWMHVLYIFIEINAYPNSKVKCNDD